MSAFYPVPEIPKQNGAPTATPPAAMADSLARAAAALEGNGVKQDPAEDAPEPALIPEEPQAALPDDEADPADEPDTEPAAKATPRLGIRALTPAQHIALMRAQWSEEDIDAVKSDAELIRHADREAKNEARNKAAFEQSKPKDTPKEGRPRRAVEASAPVADAEPTRVEAPRGLPEPVAEELGLSPKARQALDKWHQQDIDAVERRAMEAVSAVEARYEQLAATQQQAVAASRDQTIQRDLREIRGDLQADWPEIAASAVWEKVLVQAKAIAPGFEHWEDQTAARRLCLRHASLFVLGPKPEAKEAAKKAPTQPQLTRPGRNVAAEGKTRKLSATEQTLKNARGAIREHGLSEAGRRRW